MRVLRFHCPSTRKEVRCFDCEGQGEQGETALYQAVACPACLRLHFVNSSTGELLSDS